MSNSYYRWASPNDITLFMQLIDGDGLGVTGKTPQVAIRRVRTVHGGLLDNFFWTGTVFTSTPTWLSLSELDATNSPGLYYFNFEHSLIDYENVYLVYYRHTVDPIGFAVEEHVFTNEVYVPVDLGAPPIVLGDTVMHRLQDMEDPTGNVAMANADAAWDEILAGHLMPGSTGEALSRLLSNTGIAGMYQIEVELVDTLAAPVQGAQVDFYNATNTNFISREYTDVLGKAVIALDAGTYAVRLFASGYSFTVPEMLVISGDGSVTYIGTSLMIIAPPSAPNLCVIYGTIRNAAGQPIPGAQVQAWSVTPQALPGVQESSKIACTITDGTGFFRLELERKLQVNLKIDEAGLDVYRTVPDTASQDVTTWV